MKLVSVLYLLFFIFGFTHGAEILAFFPIGGSSHYLMPEAVIKALATRGHNITVVSSYPQKKPIANIHDIDISSIKGHAKNSLHFKIVSTTLQSTGKNLDFIGNISRTYCQIAFSFPEVHDLLKTGHKFDLVMTEIFGADCAVGFAWKFKVPLVSLLTSKRTPWTSSRVGKPENPSYLPMINTPFSSRMSFFQRLENTFWYLYFTLSYDYCNNVGQTDQIAQQFFGKDVPSANKIVFNTSLVFVNSHYTIDVPSPMVPNYIEIGGVHIKKPKALPPDIKKFMDEAEHGVIYFTLGSLIRVSTLPAEAIQGFRDAFAELPQKVLWKFELELENIPKNVFISNWFPQTDVFNHPNVKLFISHGGNAGCIEAVHYGIPMVGIPLFFDQLQNMQIFVDKGVAVSLDMNNLTKDNILRAIKTVLEDKSYEERMKQLSRRFRDRPLSPADTAVYWTEYVIRHKGAFHLRTVGSYLSWYQYFLLDVILFCISVVIICIYAIKIILSFIAAQVTRLLRAGKVKTN